MSNRKFDQIQRGLSLKRIFIGLLSLLVVSGSGLFPGDAKAVVIESGPKLTRVGPINDANGFPLWYQDSNGVKLELCLDPADPRCLLIEEDADPATLDFDPNSPIQFPGNYPGEAFYQLAEAEMPVGTNGSALGVFALEAAFNNEVPAVGDQTVFGRIRFRIDGLNPNTDYTITHPYGKDVITTDAEGIINYTEDIGAGGGFGAALNSRIGTFLTWDTGAPEGYICNPNVPHKITGGVNNQNFFRVEGPGIGSIETNQFILMGKKVVNAKVYWDGVLMKKGQIGLVTIVKPINLWKKDANNKLTFVRVLNPGEKYRVYNYDKQHFGQYGVGDGHYITNMKGYVNYATPSKQKLAELNK